MPSYEISYNIAVGNFFVYHIFTWDFFRSLNRSSQDYPVVTQPVFIWNRKISIC